MDDDADLLRAQNGRLQRQIATLRKKLDLFESGTLIFNEGRGKVTEKVHEDRGGEKMYHYRHHDSLEECYKAIGL